MKPTLNFRIMRRTDRRMFTGETIKWDELQQQFEDGDRKQWRAVPVVDEWEKPIE